ncbi:MAG TPA: alpha/beta hydrolase-fold protein [Solirubrobacteraceae bacterium]|nr:alpha/beta hydrolase-fold protein [Solirubrobacteraceae bacterium]
MSKRAHDWFDGPGEWAWPGTAAAAASAGGGQAAELLPPPWVPTLPGHFEPGAHHGGARERERSRRGTLGRRYATSLLLATLAIACIALGLDGRPEIEGLLGIRAAGGPSAAQLALERSLAEAPPALPAITPVSRDENGGAIDAVQFASGALAGQGSFLIYLPAGYASTIRRYPVLYLLHGEDQSDSSFLTIGLEPTLDRLIAGHKVPPLIAIMIQGGPGPNNWSNYGSNHYESYVLEVQRLVDRMLPTIPTREARAIAGYSMGGYGAMHIALGHPDLFSTVESWLGFFDGLEPALSADHRAISKLGLRAYVYGGAGDSIADPSEDMPFAAALRAAGANAYGKVYPGEHDFATLEANLEHMLSFAGRKLS